MQKLSIILGLLVIGVLLFGCTNTQYVCPDGSVKSTASECGTQQTNTSQATQNQTTVATCTPNWGCSEWSDCSSSGTRTRVCNDSNTCGITTGKPTESQICVNTLDPDVLVTKSLDQIMITQGDLAKFWQEKDARGNYLYSVGVGGDNNSKGFQVGSFTTSGYIISVIMATFPSIDSAKQMFSSWRNLSVSRQYTKLEDAITVGNEMRTMQGRSSAEEGGKDLRHNIIFRRNNIFVSLFVAVPFGTSADINQSMQQELQNYAIIMDNRIS